MGWVWRDPTCQFIGRDRILRGDLEWAEALDPLQVGLDVVGMVPGFGEPADGLNGGISLLRGDRVGAALSFGSMVPFAGWGATVAKWGRRGMRRGDAGRGVRQGPAVARGLGVVDTLDNGVQRGNHAEGNWFLTKSHTGQVTDFHLTDSLEETGWLGGRLVSEKRLTTLRKFLDRRKVDLLVGDEYLETGKTGAFRVPKTGRPQLILSSNPTYYLLWHELSHYIHYRRIGRDAYVNLPCEPRNVAEIAVFTMLDRPHRWMQLSPDEQMHAVKYLEDIGGTR